MAATARGEDGQPVNPALFFTKPVDGQQTLMKAIWRTLRLLLLPAPAAYLPTAVDPL